MQDVTDVQDVGPEASGCGRGLSRGSCCATGAGGGERTEFLVVTAAVAAEPTLRARPSSQGIRQKGHREGGSRACGGVELLPLVLWCDFRC